MGDEWGVMDGWVGDKWVGEWNGVDKKIGVNDRVNGKIM